MGCCNCANSGASELALPEQECAVLDLERGHPFSKFAVSELLKVLSGEDKVAVVQFEGMMEQLNVAPDLIYNPCSTLQSFARELASEGGTLDLRSLKVSGVLLGRGRYEDKFSELLKLYQKTADSVSEYEIIQMAEDLVYVSASVLPALGGGLDEYFKHLLENKTKMIENVLKTAGRKPVYSTEELLEKLRTEPELQQLTSTGGVRMLLSASNLKNSISTPGRSIQQFISDESEVKGFNLNQGLWDEERNADREPTGELTLKPELKENNTEKTEGPFVININLGPGRREQLVIQPGENRLDAARRFAEQHKLTRADKVKFFRNIKDWQAN